MRLYRHKSEWWFEPDLPKNKVRIPSRFKELDPVNSGEELPVKSTRIGAFAPSRKWVRYNRLHPFNVGYIVPVYTLRDIGLRYGLSQNSQTYFRKHILPEPFDIVRRRSVHAHHWSRFVLASLDVVLEDLQARGYQQFLKRFTDHIELLHTGTQWMANYYADKWDETLDRGDKYGVTWYND